MNNSPLFLKSFSRKITTLVFMGALTLVQVNPAFAQNSSTPVIFSVTTSYLLKSGITINWKTDKPATSVVSYHESAMGSNTLSGAYNTTNSRMSSYVTDHTISLSNLKNNTPYTFTVSSSDVFGNNSTSPEYSFRTLVGDSSSGFPSLSSFTVVDVTTNKATLKIATNEPVTIKASYWVNSSSGQSNITQTTSSLFQMEHEIILSDLNVDTEYKVKITLTNNQGRTSESNTLDFATKKISYENASPTINNITVQNITNNSALISWNTNKPTTSTVWFLKNSDSRSMNNLSSYEKVQPDFSLSTVHNITLNGLSSGTRYVYQVEGADSLGEVVRSDRLSFGTLGSSSQGADTKNPIIYNLSTGTMVRGNSRTALFMWKTNEPTMSTITYSQSSDFDNSKNVMTNTYSTNKNITLRNLNRKTYYYFKIQAKDRAGNTGSDSGVVYVY